MADGGVSASPQNVLDNIMPGSQADEIDIRWMQRAIRQAKEGDATPGGSPIGCVIVYEGDVIGEGFNEADIHCDPSAHAEIVAMRRAGKHMGSKEFRGATLYTTLQPCGMCSMASIWAKIGRIVYGAGRGDVHSSYFEDRHMNTIDFIQDAYRDDLSLRAGVLAQKCASLYIPPDADIPKEQQFNR
jgi:tRNA(adenine34) deaminase